MNFIHVNACLCQDWNFCRKRFNEKFKMSSEWLQKHTYINESMGLWANAEEIQHKFIDKSRLATESFWEPASANNHCREVSSLAGNSEPLLECHYKVQKMFRMSLQSRLSALKSNIYLLPYCPINFRSAQDQVTLLLSKPQLLTDIVGPIRKWKEQQQCKTKTAYTLNTQKYFK